METAVDNDFRAAHSSRGLGWLLTYRLSLVLVLILIFFYPQTPSWLSSDGDLSMARLLLKLQTLSVLLSAALVLLGRPKPARQIELGIFFDIVFYTMLMHASGGVSTGLGLILAIVVAAGAITLEGRLSMLFAALATLAVMAQQFYAELYSATPGGSYTQAGLLGLTYFTVALLAHVLSRRLHETEHLAARRKVDIADLSKLNEFIIQSMSTGVMAVNGERELLLINNAAKRLLGGNQARAGDNLRELSPTISHWLKRSIRSPAPPDDVLSLAEHEVRLRLQLLGNDRGGGALIFLHDNRQLVREAQEMKLASLGRLTASIAHNIRNPLSSITHAGQLLAEVEELGAEEQHLLTIVRRNALRIDETVSSILELSRRDHPQPQTLDLCAWLMEFRDEFSAGNHLDPQSLELRLPEETIRVDVDPRHIGQVLRNLVENAFTHGCSAQTEPKVVLNLTHAPNSDTIYLTVTDNGLGVPSEHIPQLFDPFFTTSSSGTGLGLYAARELCEANGMGLEYIEQQASGAQFRIILST